MQYSRWFLFAFTSLAVVFTSTVNAREKTVLIPFNTTPFPYRGEIPDQGKPFFDVIEGSRRGHTTLRGGVYWEHPTYTDRRVLLSIPPQFNARKPAIILVFLHGNESRLDRDVRDRQQVPLQLAQSGLNAVLVAPQFAVDAKDSSAGRFWESGIFAKFLDEATERIAKLHGNSALKKTLRKSPVVLIAYSGGYQPAASILAHGGSDQRIRGVILLDALYGQEEKFAEWLTRHHREAFFFSAYTEPARESNEQLQSMLVDRQIRFRNNQLPQSLKAGSITFLTLDPDVEHKDVLIQAWAELPLKHLLKLAK